MEVTKKQLELLNGNQLAKLLNKVESIMDFRYEPSFKFELIQKNK